MKNKLKTSMFNLESLGGLEKENTMYYNVGMVVLWSEDKAAANLKKHGIAFDEAATVFFAENTIEIEDSRHSEQRFVIIGFSVRTRLLTVIYAYRYEDEIRIISARKATKNEAEKYEKRI